jgi:hypothetical protein
MTHDEINRVLYQIIKWINLKLPNINYTGSVNMLMRDVADGTLISEKIITSLLISSNSDENSPLMAIYQSGNLTLALNYGGIMKYSLPRNYLEQTVWVQKYVHKWLVPTDVPLSLVKLKSTASQARNEPFIVDRSQLKPRALLTLNNAKH